VACVHTHVPEWAKALLSRVRDMLPSGDVLSVDVTPMLGAHQGTGAIDWVCVCQCQRRVVAYRYRAGLLLNCEAIDVPLIYWG